ncbi:hypothetical protein GCM10027414_24280 [Humibacter ginsengiterrae]
MAGRTPKEDVLIGGLEDWIYASWVSNSIWDLVASQYRRTLTIGLIAELLVEGLMVAGDVDDQGHHPWACSIGEAIERIALEWLTEWRDEIPTPGAVVWLANTPAGDAIARNALRRESGLP